MEKQRPKVGIGVYILNEKNRLLLLYEKREQTGGTWAPPGGHLELGEEFLECVQREVMEETGLEVLDAEVWLVHNTIAGPDWHYVNLDFLVTKFKGVPQIKEPHKCLKMEWFDLGDLPEPVLPPVTNFFKHNPPCLCKSGKKYLDCHGKG